MGDPAADDTGYETPPDILEAAASAAGKLLPEKSRRLYDNTYQAFIKWRDLKNTKSMSENVLLAYFSEQAEKFKPSTLWARYSMLKSTIYINNNIDISTYKKLIALLKRTADGFHSKKSNVLSAENIRKFLVEAPDFQYLAVKVALIFGVCGACRGGELPTMKTSDIKLHEKDMVVKVPNTKNKIPRTFTVDGEYYKIVKKYAELRPKNVTSTNFFLNYQKGKCTVQNIGKNKFGNMPKEIATFLNLENPESYTGHSFRRTSTTLLADAGANITTIKRHGGWLSDKVAEGYIQDSINQKKKVCATITSDINLPTSTPVPSTSGMPDTSTNAKKIKISVVEDPRASTSKVRPEAIKSTGGAAIDLPMNAFEPTETAIDLPVNENQTNNEITQAVTTTVNVPERNMIINISNCSNFVLFKN